jgi:hypothetical protein
VEEYMDGWIFMKFYQMISESEIAQEEEEMNLDDNNHVIVITSQINSRCLIK